MSKVTRDPFDNSQREKDEEKNLEAFRKEADFQEALINVLNTRDGMTVLKRIFDDSGFFGIRYECFEHGSQGRETGICTTGF